MGQVRHILLSVDMEKIVIPKPFQQTLLEWYHNVLYHPGETRTKLTIGQHFYWKGLQLSADIFVLNIIRVSF